MAEITTGAPALELPAGSIAFMLSGQGSQKPGMGADLLGVPEVAAAFSRASEAFGFDVADLVCSDDPDRINDTRFAQPALCALSVGIAHALEARGVEPAAVLGFSLGQIGALAVAGMLSDDQKSFADSAQFLYRSYDIHENKFVENTTIGAIITNAAFTKSQLCKIAGMTHNGYARSIRPVHTSADGDSIYALSVGNIPADCDMVGTLAADVMAEAILCAIRNTESAYGFPAYKDLSFV